MTEAVDYVSFDEFLDGESHATDGRRHELVNGRIYPMAGGTERHDLLAGLIYEALAPGARAAGCRPFTSNRLVHTRLGSAYYPDVMVACGPAPHPHYETDPTLVVEVLSPSTRNTDRREKAAAYAMSPNLRKLLLVDTNERRIEVARPVDGRIQGWDAFGPGDVVFTDYGDINIDAHYDALEATATTA